MSRQHKHKRRVYASIQRCNAVQWSDDKWFDMMRDTFSECL